MRKSSQSEFKDEEKGNHFVETGTDTLQRFVKKKEIRTCPEKVPHLSQGECFIDKVWSVKMNKFCPII